MLVQRTCAQCGATFSVRAVRVAEGNGRYCSVPCYRLGRRRRETRRCRWCGRSFELTLSWTKQPRGYWCSTVCRYAECRVNPSPRVSAEEKARRIRAKFEAAVFKGVDPERDCWSLAGDRDSDGYSLLAVAGHRQALKGHRVSYGLHKGPIPSGLVVRHTCDRPCVRQPCASAARHPYREHP